MLRKIKSFFEPKKTRGKKNPVLRKKNPAPKVMGSLFIFSILYVFITYNFFIEFSDFSSRLFKAVIAILLFWIIDKYAVPEVDTMEELKKGNVAYAIFLLALSIIFAGSFISF